MSHSFVYDVGVKSAGMQASHGPNRILSRQAGEGEQFMESLVDFHPRRIRACRGPDGGGLDEIRHGQLMKLSIFAAQGDLGKSCKACHDLYREDD